MIAFLIFVYSLETVDETTLFNIRSPIENRAHMLHSIQIAYYSRNRNRNLHKVGAISTCRENLLFISVVLNVC